jgi:small subunit ribosomal protein S16
MLSMRLMRFGAKKKPSYRIVVMEAKSPRQGQAREFLGTYNPLHDPPLVEIDLEKTRSWLAKGARPSQTVKSIIDKASKSGAGSARHKP